MFELRRELVAAIVAWLARGMGDLDWEAGVVSRFCFLLGARFENEGLLEALVTCGLACSCSYYFLRVE